MLTDIDRNKLKNAKGLRFCIDMMCKDCIYDPLASGKWRQQVGNCTVTRCPLYEVRPQSKGQKSG